MKKIITVVLSAVVFAFCFSLTAYANMAAPKYSDVGSSVTFEKNDTISVLSEVLDITVKGIKADIRAVYRMKNTSNESVSTNSMFLSPNIEENGVSVTVNGNEVQFTSESFKLNYSTEIKTNEWQYAVLSEQNGDYGEIIIDAVSFEMSFEPDEEYDVTVSYSYSLGGYPEREDDAKCGRISYYLSPAAMWKDFSSLTINLYLDESMPVIEKSTPKFRKTGRLSYQYTSDTLPDEDLFIEINQDRLQSFFAMFKSPYAFTSITAILLAVLIVAGFIALIVWFIKMPRIKR